MLLRLVDRAGSQHPASLAVYPILTRSKAFAIELQAGVRSYAEWTVDDEMQIYLGERIIRALDEGGGGTPLLNAAFDRGELGRACRCRVTQCRQTRTAPPRATTLRVRALMACLRSTGTVPRGPIAA